MRDSFCMDLEGDKFKEECGVFGIYSPEGYDVASITYFGLYALQHRGQESAGIAVSDGERIKYHKDMGLVSDVFSEKILAEMKGISAIGHVRYSTSGSSNVVNAHPIVAQYKLGQIAIAHNGNLVNADVIRELLEDGGTVFQTSSDTEVILHLIGRAAKKGIETAIVNAIQAVKGSYAIVIQAGDKLIGVRDPQGIRPMCLGKIGNSYILSSESCALDTVGADFVRDINPGEIVIIDNEGIKSINFGEKTRGQVCAFEYIYFARPDSTIDGINVYESRVKAGRKLFEEHPVEADVVIGVPDSGIPAAIGFANASGIPFGIGFIKNRYVGRTFITPTQEMRERAVSIKLNPLKVNVDGKRVVVIDDSIVRGTTSRKLVETLRKAGATEVHFRISSPVVKYPCYFGIDTPYRSELIGARMTVEEMNKEIESDSLGFLSQKALVETISQGKGFCLGCFSGVYPVAAPMETPKERMD